MRTTITTATVTVLSLLPFLATAHPGHGETGSTLTHILEPEHAIPILVIAVASLAMRSLRKAARS